MAHPLEKVAISDALPLETVVPPVILGFNHETQRPIMHPHRPAKFKRNRTNFTWLFFGGGETYWYFLRDGRTDLY